MKKRTITDRRVKSVKVSVNRRKQVRRKEDKDNIGAYYFMVGLMGVILFSVGVTSYLIK